MPQRSKVQRLPWELRAELEKLWREGRYTLDELIAKLKELSAGQSVDLPSRSGLHAYLKNFDTKLQRYKEAQEIAGMWIARLGEDPHGDVGRLLAEVLKTIAIQTVDQMGESGKPAKAGELMALSIALKNIAQSDKLSADRELKIRKELAQKVDQKVEEARASGIDSTVLERAKELVRGALDG
jgi:hypothetical protein